MPKRKVNVTAKKKRINSRISVKSYLALEKLSAKKGMTMSEAVRIAINLFLVEK